ncbi:MAG: hypothetical protein KatS3mg029_0379 [Saprospiraceae bacterium]|nr:MAG: hypothetical protein KatS3mg029_0379 [Saprospiraceae bacterium]
MVFLLVVFENRGGGVVHTYAGKAHLGRQDEFVEHFGPIRIDVAGNGLQFLDEFRFEVEARFGVGMSDGAQGVLEHLCSFDARHFCEKPGTTRVHEHAVPLHFQHAQGGGGSAAFEWDFAVLFQKPPDIGRRAVEHHVDVIVAGLPDIFEQRAGFFFENFPQPVAQPVEGLAQRSPPGLVPAGAAARVTAAIRAPTLHTMNTAPRRRLVDGHLVLRRVQLQEMGVVGDGCQLVGSDVVDARSQGHFAEAVVMAVALPIGGDVRQFRRVIGGEDVTQAFGKCRSVVEDALECDGLGILTIVEKQVDGFSRGEVAAVGAAGIHVFL